MNVFSKAFVKFIQRKRIFCEGDACCMSYGKHVQQDKNGNIYLFCDKHNQTLNETNQKKSD